MSKQEEIQKEIANLTRDRFKYPSESAGLDWDENFNYLLAGDILSYLQSQGVVIRVVQEYPLQPHYVYKSLIDREGSNAGNIC